MMNFMLFIILFGILVFIHEFGHFIVAKRSGVLVEKFFLGFGPKIFGVKKGETEYGINWIPLGGYVKLFGEDPSDEKEGEKTELPKERSFMSKPPLVRIAIVSAGPVANLVLPVILFAFLYFIGIPSLAPVIGDVIDGSPASKAGMLAGDKVVAINGEKIAKWDDLKRSIEKSDGKEMSVEVVRGNGNVPLKILPTLSRIQNIYRESVDGWTIGVTPYRYEPAIGVLGEKSAPYRSGLRNGDIIKEINSVPVEYYWQADRFISEKRPSKLNLKVERSKDGKKEMVDASLAWNKKFASLRDGGIFRSELFVSSVKAGSIAAEKGMKPGDMIASVNGKQAVSWFDLDGTIRDNKGEAVEIELLREGKLIKLELVPKLTKGKDELTGAEETKRELGVESYAVFKDKPAIETVERTYNPFVAVYLGGAKTLEILKTQAVGFYKLLQGRLSIKNIGGPILIYKLAGRSYEMGGILSFISYIALLSIVLGFVNILPIPILDGGHILFYTVELIKRKPLSLKTREMALKVGFAVIIGLVLLASYNDVERFFWQKIVQFFRGMF